ncbi:MAG TPA: hypothetical protein VKE26_24545 [Xanthobacteraceae bacterium]|nr:hypothetical protein [Xanthobacteraceae bacterium]
MVDSRSTHGCSIGRQVMAAVCVLAVPTLANAEVCDKVVGENWRTADGPVWLLNPSGFPLGLVMLIGCLVLVLAARLWWLGLAVSALLASGSLLYVLVDLLPDQDIYRAARYEGCRSYQTDLLDLGLRLFLAVVFAWLGYRARRDVIANRGT